MIDKNDIMIFDFIFICYFVGENTMTDLSIKNLSYVDNFKHTVMGNFANFKGRASRSEYWRFYGITIVIAGIINVLSALFMDTALASVFGLISMAYNVAILLPSIGLGVRRLHDVGKSGWMLLISLVPFGIIYVIYLLAQKGDEDINQYGTPVSYEVITAEEAARTGLKETPTEDMDRKFMFACIGIFIFEVILMGIVA